MEYNWYWVLGVLNDAILLHVQLWRRNLLWYAGMTGIVYSFGKALLPAKEATPSVTRNLFEDIGTALKKVSQYTHFTIRIIGKAEDGMPTFTTFV